MMDKLDKLYHYTSRKGLLGIIQNHELWMTNILYLNDSREFMYTLELVKSEIDKWIDEVSNNPSEGHKLKILSEIKIFCDDFPENHFLVDDVEYYVFSLTTKGDDLNQWRGYCPEGGFSIGFDCNKLLSFLKTCPESYNIQKCVYKSGNQEELLQKIFDYIYSGFSSGTNDHSISEQLFRRVGEISTYIKDESFSDEQEYRIIHEKITRDGIHFYEGKSMLIPYITFKPRDERDRLPISKIVIGPTPHPQLSKLSIESILITKGYGRVEVECSKVPYRSW